MDVVAVGAIQGIHCDIKSFYGRLSSILNNFDRGKNATFSGLIREIYLRSGSNRSVEKPLFTVPTAQL